jgi:hypothetical protein
LVGGDFGAVDEFEREGFIVEGDGEDGAGGCPGEETGSI